MGAIELNNSSYKIAAASNLKAYYRFESVLTDTTANANNLTGVNSPTYATGMFGNGVDLELSSSQYATAPDSSSLDFTTSVSISAWIKPESLATNHTITCKGRANGDANTRYNIGLTSTGKVRFVYASAGPVFHEWNTTATPVTAGAWYHVVLTYTYGTAASIVAYVNGQAYTGSWIGGTGASAVLAETDVLHVGCIHSVSGAGEFFDGIIDDLAIFGDTIISADQVKELYEGRSVGELWPNYSANLQGLWHLSGVTDSSKNGYHLTNNGTTTFVPGRFGNCGLFNGSSQYLSIANASAANLYTTGDQTVFAWVYPTSFATNARSIVSNSNSSVNTGWSLQTDVTTGVINFRSFKSGDDQSATGSALALNAWNFVAVSYTSSGQNVTFFVNGVRSTGTLSRALVATTGDTAIGRLGSFSAQYWTGNIDEVAYFNSALTDSQIKEYYAWAKGLRTSTP